MLFLYDVCFIWKMKLLEHWKLPKEMYSPFKQNQINMMPLDVHMTVCRTRGPIISANHPFPVARSLQPPPCNKTAVCCLYITVVYVLFILFTLLWKCSCLLWDKNKSFLIYWYSVSSFFLLSCCLLNGGLPVTRFWENWGNFNGGEWMTDSCCIWNGPKWVNDRNNSYYLQKKGISCEF